MITYYMDADVGDDDHNDGLSEEAPWQTLARLEQVETVPGEDFIKFRRGQVFRRRLTLRQRVRRWLRRSRARS